MRLPPHLVYFYTMTARVLVVPSSLPLSFPLSPSLASHVCPSPSCVSSTRSAPLAHSLSLCVYQVIGCEMKSNENPFRRVHSRSTVGRVAQPRSRLVPILSISVSLSLFSHPFATLVTLPSLAHLRFSSWFSATSAGEQAIDVLCVSRSQPGECTTSGRVRDDEGIV